MLKSIKSMTDVLFLKKNADIAYEALSNLPGIEPKRPQGAMYMMFGVNFEHFPGIKDDADFVQQLMKEQSVFCLPTTVITHSMYLFIVLRDF
jgi:tyrosine aminotransferase